MEWDIEEDGQGDATIDVGSVMEGSSRNPWQSESEPSSSKKSSSVKTRTTTSKTPANPLYTSPTVDQPACFTPYRADGDDQDLIREATRPSLRRLTSARNAAIGTGNGIGIANGAVGSNTLHQRSEDANASTESLISTQDGSIRRSLDELRRLATQGGGSTAVRGNSNFKGKGKARAASESSAGLDLENSLLDSTGIAGQGAQGREALLHTVEKGDTLIGIALLYGCTTQSIRTANKLWLNDPIHFRKTLHIPLDACTQPPSRDIEFIQVPGELALRLYARKSSSTTTALHNHLLEKVGGSNGSTSNAGRRSRSSTANSSSEYTSPYGSHRSSFDAGNRPQSVGGGGAESLATYLSSTNSDYGEETYSSANVSVGRAARILPGTVSSETATKIIPIVHIAPLSSTSRTPGLRKSQSSFTLGYPSPPSLSSSTPPLLIGLNTPTPSNENIDPIAAHVSSTSGFLTPSSSGDRLSSLGAVGQSSESRLRSRSPLLVEASSPALSSILAAAAQANKNQQGDGLPSSSLLLPNGGQSVRPGNGTGSIRPSLPKSRPRKTSKPKVPTVRSLSSAPYSSSIPTTNSTISSSSSNAMNDVLNAGSSLLNSIWKQASTSGRSGGNRIMLNDSSPVTSKKKGGGGGGYWLALAPDEEEMQLARDYRNRNSATISTTKNGSELGGLNNSLIGNGNGNGRRR